jgi:hypothetical protein
MSTRWLYIGCKLSELPPGFIEDSKKKTKEEIREILQAVPIEDGSVMANSEDELVKILISNGIFPIKIKPYNNIDNKILKLRNIRNRASKVTNSDKYIEEARILTSYPDFPKVRSYKLVITIAILIIIALAAYYFYDHRWFYFNNLEKSR